VGGWINVYQQVQGIATLSRFLLYYLRPDWLVSSGSIPSDSCQRAPPLSHHLN